MSNFNIRMRGNIAVVTGVYHERGESMENPTAITTG